MSEAGAIDVGGGAASESAAAGETLIEVRGLRKTFRIGFWGRRVEAVNPAVVVASAGRANRYGHPHPSVVARVEARGVPFYRTDRDGAVAIDTDGRWLRVTACDGATTWWDARQAR